MLVHRIGKDPTSRLLLSAMNVMLVRSLPHDSSGTSPVRSFFWRLRRFKVEGRCFGRVPESAFQLRSRSTRPSNRCIDAGSVPVSWLLLRSMCSALRASSEDKQLTPHQSQTESEEFHPAALSHNVGPFVTPNKSISASRVAVLSHKQKGARNATHLSNPITIAKHTAIYIIIVI